MVHNIIIFNFAKISLNIAYHPMTQPIIPHLIPQLYLDDFYCH
jgi:hypothetical protein